MLRGLVITGFTTIKIFKYSTFLLLSILFITIVSSAFGIDKTNTLTKSNELEKKPVFKPLDYIKGDTLNNKTVDNYQVMPGGTPSEFLPFQDSAYFHDLKYKLPVETRLRFDLDKFEAEWELHRELLEGSGWYTAYQNLAAIPKKYLTPSGIEIVQRQEMIRRGMYAPGVHNLLGGGLQIPMGSVLSFFGLQEDVSPVISYSLDIQDSVEIVIYSVNAAVVTTLFKGVQKAGAYKITWNYRDDQGKYMPAGDYVSEVRIGRHRFVRKRIVKP